VCYCTRNERKEQSERSYPNKQGNESNVPVRSSARSEGMKNKGVALSLLEGLLQSTDRTKYGSYSLEV